MEQTFLADLIRHKHHVRVFVTNGFQMTGRILDHSDQAILIREDGGGREDGVQARDLYH